MVAAGSGLDETDEEWNETMQGMWVMSRNESLNLAKIPNKEVYHES